MVTEIHQLRAMINQLRGQVQQQAAPPPPPPVVNPMPTRDIGEAIKPPKPAPFNGDARDVIPFLTRCKGYFELFPTKLASAKARALFAGQLMEGTAAAWMEPITRDFLSNEEVDQDQDTVNIFSDWDNFEAALKDAFGLVNEERQAAAQLFTLNQTKSCAAYAALFRQLASKTEFDDESLMEVFYRGLKSEVKDELYKADRPDNLNEYVAMAVKIDERQYERRKEKAMERNKPRGASFNPYFPNQRRQQDNRGNQRQPRGGTSYGTHAGPMELGAVQRGPKNIECYYCHKKGHKANECRKKQRDIQEGRYKPRERQSLPEGKKQVRFIQSDNEPQTAIRTTKTLGMARQGYDRTGLQPGEVVMPHQAAYLTKQQAEGNYVISNVTKERLHEPAKPPKAHRLHLTDSHKWEPLPEPDNKDDGTTSPQQRTIAVLKRAEAQPEPTAGPPNAPRRTTAITRSNRHHEPINRSQYSEGARVRRELDAIETRRRRRDPHVALWEDDYEILVKEETGERYWLSANTRHIQLARERQNVDDAEDIHVRAYHEEQAMNPRQPELRLDLRDDPRTMSTHPRHEEISWVSCKDHRCSTHIADKRKNDCFPVQLRQPNTRPYLAYETFQYKIQEWYEGIGVATLRFYPTKEGAVSLERWFTIATWRTMTEQGKEPDGSCPNAEATLCCEETCPRHGQQVLATHERIERMAKEGFNFLTHQGKQDDREWYEGIRPYLRKDHGPTDKVLQEYADYIRRGDLDRDHPETSQQPDCTCQDDEDRMAEQAYQEWLHDQDDHDYDACADSECEYDHLGHAIMMSKN